MWARMKNKQIEHTFPCWPDLMHISLFPCCYNPLFFNLGPWSTSLNSLSDVSLLLFSHQGYQPRAEPPRLRKEPPHCPLGACWDMNNPLQPAEQYSFGCFGNPLPFSPNLPARTPSVTWPQLAVPEEGQWIDCYQNSRQPSLGWAARLLLLESEVLISRLQRPAYMIYLEVAFLSADAVLVQPDCLVKQPQEWILFASVQRRECKIFTSQESKTPSSLANIN